MKKKLLKIILPVFFLFFICGITTITVQAADESVKLRISALKKDGSTELIKNHKNLEDGWNEAMELATDGKKLKSKGYKAIVVDLLTDWNAKGGEFTDDFFNGTGFNWDAIYIPDDAKVVLNLNGHTINRGLKDWEYNGEVMYIDEDAQVVINGGKNEKDKTMGTITGGFSCNGAGGIHINDGARVTLNYVSVSGNAVEDDDGAGIAVYDGATLIMNGGELAKNRMVYGASVAPCHGGGLYVSDATATLNNVKIYRNSTEADSGGVKGFALALSDATVTLNNCDVYDNACTQNNRLIYLECFGNLIINNSRIYNNTAGSIIFSELNDSINIKDSELYDNTGNVLYLRGSSTKISVNNTTIRDNGGAAVLVATDEIIGSFRNCKFNNNNIYNYALAALVFERETDITFENCSLGDSEIHNKQYAKFNNSGVGSMFGGDSLPLLLSVLSLIVSFAAITNTLMDKKKKENGTSAASE